VKQWCNESKCLVGLT